MPQASWIREGSEPQTLEQNWLFRLRRERFRSISSGQSHDFYVMHLADAVNVVALTPERHVILVRQFRAGSEHDSLETPGGLLGPGEDPLSAGTRELLEETGYEGDPPLVLGTVWANPSILTSKITTILITNAQQVAEPHLDTGEEVTVELVPAAVVPFLIRNRRIDHALAVMGLLWWLVAELPGPLELPETLGPLRSRRQYSIRGIMIAIAGIALVLGFIRALSSDVFVSVLWIVLSLAMVVSFAIGCWRATQALHRFVNRKARGLRTPTLVQAAERRGQRWS